MLAFENLKVLIEESLEWLELALVHNLAFGEVGRVHEVIHDAFLPYFFETLQGLVFYVLSLQVINDVGNDIWLAKQRPNDYLELGKQYERCN